MQVRLSDVSRVHYQKGGVGRYDHLNFSMLDGTTESAGVFLAEACLFFLHAVRRRLRQRNGKFLQQAVLALSAPSASSSSPADANSARKDSKDGKDAKSAPPALAGPPSLTHAPSATTNPKDRLPEVKARERADFLSDGMYVFIWRCRLFVCGVCYLLWTIPAAVR